MGLVLPHDLEKFPLNKFRVRDSFYTQLEQLLHNALFIDWLASRPTENLMRDLTIVIHRDAESWALSECARVVHVISMRMSH